jgi:NAD(P)-dependent dehydrogenase (short-subunit alcohol dehydrogenase family)
MKELKNKKALVTGASRGIGKSIAIQLASLGVHVLIHYHNKKEEAQEVARLITTLGGKAEIIAADIGDAGQAIQLANDAWKMMKGIDILINNAGVSYKKHFLDTTLDDIDHFTNINFKGTLLVTQGIAKNMIAAEVEGSIFTITSINAIQPGVGLSVYGATKGALETLMKGVALELASHNISVNSFAVGAIQTDMNEETWKNPERLELVSKNIPLGRLGQPEEVAEVICSLLSSGTYITGATIRIDGGWTMKQGYSNPKRYDTNK